MMKRQLLALILCLSGATASFAQTNRHNNLGQLEHLWKMRSISDTTFIAVGNNGTVLRYRTSCNDWLPVNPPGSTDDFRNLSFPTPATGYISGPSNAFYKTTDGGNNWSYIGPSVTGLTNASIQCVHFISADTGFIAGSQLGVSGGGRFIKRTTDGGVTWTDVTPATISTSTVYDMAFFTPGVGIAVATNNKAFRTTDNGLTWTAVTTPATAYSVATAGNSTAVAVANGNIIRSTDQGLTWTSVAAGATGMQGVHFYDNNNGMIAAANGTILHTTDGGLTWNAIPTLLSQKIYDVVMTGSGQAVAVGANGIVLDVDKNQAFHRLFDERFCHPSDSISYTRYVNTDLSGSQQARKWFFENVNEDENGLLASAWFPGKFAIYDAYYYEDILGRQHKDSAYIETRALDFSGTTALSLQWNEAFYTHPDFLSTTRIDGFDGTGWITLYTNKGLNYGDNVASAIFPSYKRNIDISALAGAGTARLRFYYIAPNTQDGLKNFWAISDIEVRNQVTDIAVDSVTIANATTCLDLQPRDISIHISNPGALDVFPLEFGWASSDGQSGHNADYTVLSSGNTYSMTLVDDFVPNIQAGTVTFKAWISNTPDHNNANDTFALQLTYLPAATGAGFLGNDTTICPGSPFTLSVLPGTSGILWSDGSVNPSLDVQTAGTYYVSGLLNTCPVSDTVRIDFHDVTVPVITRDNGSLKITPAAYSTIEWYKNDLPLPGTSGQTTIANPASGTYQVRITTPEGCTAVSAPYEHQPSGIGEMAASESIRLYPVPVEHTLTVTAAQPFRNGLAHLYNSVGKVVMTTAIPPGSPAFTIDMATLPAGIYLLRITDETGVFNARITRQ